MSARSNPPDTPAVAAHRSYEEIDRPKGNVLPLQDHPPVQMKSKMAEDLENYDKPGFSNWFASLIKKWGYHVFWFALLSIIGLYVLDVIIINNNLVNSEFISPLLDTLKFVMSSMIGFVFAKEAIGNQKGE